MFAVVRPDEGRRDDLRRHLRVLREIVLHVFLLVRQTQNPTVRVLRRREAIDDVRVRRLQRFGIASRGLGPSRLGRALFLFQVSYFDVVERSPVLRRQHAGHGEERSIVRSWKVGKADAPVPSLAVPGEEKVANPRGDASKRSPPFLLADRVLGRRVLKLLGCPIERQPRDAHDVRERAEVFFAHERLHERPGVHRFAF